jgi:hypothetical protein
MAKKLNLSKFKKRICFDLDGVICKTQKNFYRTAKPIKSNINKINQLYDDDNYILVYTARFMGRSKENSLKAKKRGYFLTLSQLKKWGLKFHKLMMGKPSYDVIVDDKAINYSLSWKKKL